MPPLFLLRPLIIDYKCYGDACFKKEGGGGQEGPIYKEGQRSSLVGVYFESVLQKIPPTRVLCSLEGLFSTI